MIFFLILIALNGARGMAENEYPCSFETRDTVLILDGSSSIIPSEYQQAKNLIKKTIAFIFNYNPDNRIAFILFADEAFLIFDLNQLNNSKDMMNALDQAQPEDGRTAIGKALNLTFVELYPKMRKEIRKTVILFTDGTNNVFPAPHIYSEKLKELGVEIMAVGIGSDINKKELIRIASPGMQINADKFSSLNENFLNFTTQFCYIKDPMILEPCKEEHQDLVIVMDMSQSIEEDDYEKAKVFLIKLLKSLKIGPDTNRVAMLSFSDTTNLDFDFELADFQKIASKIMSLKKFGYTTGIGLALQEVQNTIQPKRRRDVPFNILLITDGYNNMYPRPLPVAKAMKADKINFICLGIGEEINVMELKAISSDDKVFTVESYDALLKSLKTITRVVVCG